MTINCRAVGATIVALLLFLAPPASAEKPDTTFFGIRISGKEFLETCRAKDGSQSRCLGYVMGLSDGIAIFQNAVANGRASYVNWNSLCTPDTVSGQDMVKALVTFLELNPERLEQPIIVLFTTAMRASWPCDP